MQEKVTQGIVFRMFNDYIHVPYRYLICYNIQFGIYTMPLYVHLYGCVPVTACILSTDLYAYIFILVYAILVHYQHILSHSKCQ